MRSAIPMCWSHAKRLADFTKFRANHNATTAGIERKHAIIGRNHCLRQNNHSVAGETWMSRTPDWPRSGPKFSHAGDQCIDNVGTASRAPVEFVYSHFFLGVVTHAAAGDRC